MPSQAEAIGAALRADIARAAKALTLQLARELKVSTPVDTGHARANWVPSVGSVFTGEASGTSSAEYASGAAQVASYVLEQGPLWVANNVPYIESLNYGHSQQAPALFVEAAVDRALAVIEQKFGSGAVGFTREAFQSEVGSEGADNLASAYSPFGGDDD